MLFFISYRHGNPEEENLARTLAEEIRRRGHQTFIDLEIPAFADWVAKIQEAIASCDFLVTILSRESVASEMVQAEVRLAHRRFKRERKPAILPIRFKFQDALEYELDSYIGRLQYVSWNGGSDTARVIEQVIATAAGGTLSEQQPQPARPAQVSQPLPTFDPRNLSIPGGTLDPEDPLYIERACDEIVRVLASATGRTLVVKGARQRGKSSLVNKYLARCYQAKKRTALLDLSVLAEAELDDYPAFLSSLALLILQELGLPTDSEPKIGTQIKMVEFMQIRVLKALEEPVVLAFDEVDRVLGRPYQADFFSMLRSWHNSRSRMSSVWKRLDLALAISTEPYLLIQNGDRSPFNVGEIIHLDTFSEDECATLNARYGNLLNSSQLDSLYELLGGHPYLTRLAYHRLTGPVPMAFDALIEKAAAPRGPFGDHLRALLTRLTEAPGLLQAMRLVIRNKKLDDEAMFSRLHGAGLVRREADTTGERMWTLPSTLLYAKFFGNV